MIEKMGAKKYGFPVLVILLVACVMALMFYPMINMAPKELPFAVLSLDEGAQTPQGDVFAGEMMAEQLVGAGAPKGADVAPIKWEKFDDQVDVDAALADNELYGVLTIPADFTEAQVLAEAGKGEPAAVTVVLDNAKSPMAATQMQAALGDMFQNLGVPAQITIINTGNGDNAPTSPLAGMMSQQIGVFPLMIMSLVGSILLTRIFSKRGAIGSTSRFITLGKQLAYAVGFSLLAAIAAVVLLNTLVGPSAPFWTTTVFLWVAGFSVMLLLLGAFNIATPVGGLVAVLAILCGMMTTVLPREMLPGFWADWIYPWSPQHFTGDGIRDMLFRGADLMPLGTGGLLMLGGLGLVLLVVSGLVPASGSKDTTDGRIVAAS